MSKLSKGAKELLKQTENLTEGEDKPTAISYFETPDYILEQIKVANDANNANSLSEGGYIKYNKKTGTTEVVEDFYYENVHYVPITNDLTHSISLAGGVTEYGNLDNLVGKIKEFYNYNFQVPAKFEKFLPYLCLYTWVYERFPTVPYLNFVGLTGTGKTTAMEVFGTLCYKTLDVSGSITMASIFRTTTVWKGTLLLDEFDTVGDEARAMISFLKSGFGDRAVLRVEGDKIREVKAYLVKCPKIFTSEKPITDAGLQSRTLVIQMEKNKRKVPLYRLNKFKKQAEEIKSMLLLWRLRNLNKIDLEELEYGYETLGGFDSRVQQVITPIYYLADDTAKKEILEFAKEQQVETHRQRLEAHEGIIFNAIYEIRNNREPLYLEDITKKFNDQATPYKDWTNIRVSNVVRKILGFATETVGHENKKVIVVEEEKFKELCLYYGLLTRGGYSLKPLATFASFADPREKETFLDQFEGDTNES